MTKKTYYEKLKDPKWQIFKNVCVLIVFIEIICIGASFFASILFGHKNYQF